MSSSNMLQLFPFIYHITQCLCLSKSQERIETLYQACMASIEDEESKKGAKRKTSSLNKVTDAKSSKKLKSDKEETNIQEDAGDTDAVVAAALGRKERHATLNHALLQKARHCQEKANGKTKVMPASKQSNKSIESFEKDIAAETLCQIRNTGAGK